MLDYYSYQFPNLLYVLYFGIFGAFLGSFVNVVIIRMGEGRSVIFPPSSCPYCNHRLSAIDLIPIFGWIILFGRCRYCKAPISIQYPLVELFTAILLAYNAYQWNLSAEPVIKFIINSSLSVIFFVNFMLFIREEVLAPTPYILTILYYFIYKYFTNNLNFLNFEEYKVLIISIILSLFSLIYEKKFIFIVLGISFCLLTYSTSFTNIIITTIEIAFFSLFKKYNNQKMMYICKTIIFFHFVISLYSLISR